MVDWDDIGDGTKEEWQNEQEDIVDQVQGSLEERDKQVAAHYEYGFRMGRSESVSERVMGISEEKGIDIDEDHAHDLGKRLVKRACKNRFMDDFGMTFSPDAVSVESLGEGWAKDYKCVVMKDE